MSTRTRVAASVAVALLLSFPALGRAGETPKGKAHTWSNKGPNSVHSASRSARGQPDAATTYEIDVKVHGTHAEADIKFGGKQTMSANRHVEGKTSFQLSVTGEEGSKYKWAAFGDMTWSGHADIGAAPGYTARLSAFTGMTYTADLKLRGAAHVAVHTGESYESTHSISVDPGIDLKVKRTSHQESDEVEGGGNDARSGDGPDVRVDVSNAASAYFSATRASGTTGSGDGRGQAVIDGKVVLTVIATPPAGAGPSTPGGEPSGPSTGTGTKSKTYRVSVLAPEEPDPKQLTKKTGHPTPAPGSEPIDDAPGLPDIPKNPTHEHKQLEGIDEHGNFWYLEVGNELDDQE